jgi:hypothetical protein
MGEFAHPKSLNAYGGAGPGWNRNIIHDMAVVEMATTQLQTGDITWLMYVPAGAVVVDGFVKASDMDTGTSLAYNIGDATTTNLFFANTTTGQTATSSGILAAARYTKFASATRLKLTVATTAETAAAGRIHFGLSYFIDPELNVTTGVTPITVVA